MLKCPYCGHANYNTATECRKCQGPLVKQGGTVYAARAYLVGPERARRIRDQALSGLVLGLLIKVYWGGYGPWPIMDNPTLAGIRGWLEPLLLYGGAGVYVLGWVLAWI
jgi:hypothetical protein